MRCAECAAEVPPLREFCPKCGAPTDPGLREGRHQLDSRPRSGEELKVNRKKVLLIVAAAVGLGFVANRAFDPDFFDSDHGSTIPSRPKARGPVVIDADQLYQAYRDDEKSADRRFAGREMVVTGEFLRMVPDGYGSLDLRLKTSNPEVQVGIDLAQLALDDGKKLTPGQKVTVSCQGMGGSGNELWVRDCAVQPTGQESPAGTEASAPASPPQAPAPPTTPPAGEGNSG